KQLFDLRILAVIASNQRDPWRCDRVSHCTAGGKDARALFRQNSGDATTNPLGTAANKRNLILEPHTPSLSVSREIVSEKGQPVSRRAAVQSSWHSLSPWCRRRPLLVPVGSMRISPLSRTV